jgi:hypothetical protein
VAVRATEVASRACAHYAGLSGREWEKALRLSMTSPRRPLRERDTRGTRMLKRQGRQRCWLWPASQWRAHGGDSSQGPSFGMVVHHNVAVWSYSDVHASDGAGGLRRNEEELGGAHGS